jgi:outer membrane protein assembly factor BamB
VKWKEKLVGTLSSPSIAPNGAIHVSFIQKLQGEGYSSAVFSIDPSRATNWWRAIPDNGYSTASPKTWQHTNTRNVFTFFPVHTSKGSELFIFDSKGEIVRREVLCGPVTEGGTSVDPDLWKIFLGILTAGFSLIFTPFEFKIPPIEDGVMYGWLDPTVALTDSVRITGSPTSPIIVVASNGCGIFAFRFNPTPSIALTFLSPLWKDTTNVSDYSSPAISSGGVVVVGRKDGHVIAYDVVKGNRLWDYNAHEEMMAAPAFFPGGVLKVYVASSKKVHSLDLVDGSLVNQADLPDSTRSSPVTTLDRVYVSSSSALHTLQFDLTPEIFHSIPGGLSSPAIGKDGSVIYASGDGYVHFYPGP